MSFTKWTDGDILYASKLNTQFNGLFLQIGINTIRQLMDRAIEFSKGNIDGWGEAYVDADGQLNSVNTYDSQKPSPSDNDGSGTSLNMNFTTTNNYNYFYISRIQIAVMNNAGLDIDVTIKNSSGNAITGTKSVGTTGWDIDITYDIEEYSELLSANENFSVVITKTGGDGNISIKNNYSFSGNVFTGGSQTYLGSTGSGGYGITVDGLITTAKFDTNKYKVLNLTDSVIQHTIPSGTFPSNINTAFGIPFIADWEDGADIQYKLTNSSEDSGWLNYGEVNSFTAFTSEPTTLIVKLIPKSSSPTAGYPSIKGFYINAWNDE